MEGLLFKGVAGDGSFRLFGAETTNVVKKARRYHHASPTAIAALGRALTGALLLSADFKNPEDRIMIQINGGGPLGEILTEADGQGNARGYVQHPEVHLPPINKKLNVGQAVGKKGFLSIVRDLGLKEPYQSSVPLVSGEIAEDLSYYLLVSEQVPSAVSLGVLVDVDGEVRVAGGFIIQTMPGASNKEISKIEKNIRQIPSLTNLMDKGIDLEAILEEIFDPLKTKILERRHVRYHCKCSIERVEEALIALGSKEIEDLMFKQKIVTITCDFCSRQYRFTQEDLKRVLEEIEARKGASR